MAKKNLHPRNPKDLCIRTKNTKNSILNFSIPKYHEGKTCYVDFFCYDPVNDKMRRVKKHFDCITGKRLRRMMAQEYIYKACEKLRSGWNPFVDVNNDHQYEKLSSVLEKYENYLRSSFDRKKTVSSYLSRVNILREYLDKGNMPITYCYEMTKEFCISFLDWLRDERDSKPRTINNYKGWLSSLSKYMIDRNFLAENPVAGIAKFRETEKIRKPLSKLQLKRVFDYFHAHDKYFLLACLFEYFTFIRPQELSHVKIEDINVMSQTVFVPGTVSKNRKDGVVSLNSVIIKLMIELRVLEAPMSYYLFGKNFVPSAERGSADQFNKRWTYHRKKIGLTEEYKFYSLKDSGITDLANDKGIVEARNQARHSDISTTNKYLRGKDAKGPQGAKEYISDLFK